MTNLLRPQPTHLVLDFNACTPSSALKLTSHGYVSHVPAKKGLTVNGVPA